MPDPRTGQQPPTPPTDQEDTRTPQESWRGGGLAEDVGTEPPREAATEEDREEQMREAERRLGLASTTD